MNIARPAPLFLGYALKSAKRPIFWTVVAHVEDICSVSECIAKRPKGWIERWDFNKASFYATPGAALAARPAAEESPSLLFAYELFPLRFEPAGGVTTIDPADVFGGPLAPTPDSHALSSFAFLGYDAVERWDEPTPGASGSNAHGGFGCSPLSCNSEAVSHPVNRHCLLDRWDDAVAAAIAFAREQPEPGCYYMFGVWRSTAGAPAL